MRKYRAAFLLFIIFQCGFIMCAQKAQAASETWESISRFASRAELRSSISNVAVIEQPEEGDIEIEEKEFWFGEPHGTKFWYRRARSEVYTSKIRPLISIGETKGGQWRVPLKWHTMRAVIPGYAERRIIDTRFYESTNIPGVYNILGIGSMNVYSYSLTSQWDAFKNRTLEFSFHETKVRGNATCSPANPNCRPSMRSDIWRLELYPDDPGKLDWNVRLERHDRERFTDVGYHLRFGGEYDVYRGLKFGLTTGILLNGMNPAGDEFSEIADHLVFQYLNGSSTSFNQFYTKTFAYYKLTLGYNLEF